MTGGELPRRAFVAQIMGLPVSVHIRGPKAGEDEVAAAVDRLFGALRADDELFSTWNPDSPISRIRDGRDSLAEAVPRIRQVLALCELAGQRTGGAFSAFLPGPDGRRRFDPTGLVKGWAVQEAFTRLVSDLAPLERHDAMVNAGGDIAVHCTRTDTPDWSMGVEDPRDPSQVICRFGLRTGAVATSGTAARGAHILDPSTGLPATGLLSATVVGPELTWADVYATAAFVQGPRSVAWLATREQHASLLVHPDGTATTVRARSGEASPLQTGSRPAA